MAMRQQPGNARFWEWVGEGWVKLTLRPGQVLRRETGGRTDEGYSHASESWEHTGEGVVCGRITSGRDCDGRHEHAAEYFCPLHLLASVPADEDERPNRPEWAEEDSHQRDYTAEAAGY